MRAVKYSFVNKRMFIKYSIVILKTIVNRMKVVRWWSEYWKAELFVLIESFSLLK